MNESSKTPMTSPVRELRKRAGLSQPVFAAHVGIGLSTLHRIEVAPSMLSPQIAARIGEAFGIAPARLLHAGGRRRGTAAILLAGQVR